MNTLIARHLERKAAAKKREEAEKILHQTHLSRRSLLQTLFRKHYVLLSRH